MKIIYLFLIFIEILSCSCEIDKTVPIYNQSLTSFNAPLREIVLRWEYTLFGKTYDKKTGQLIGRSGVSGDTVFTGKSRIINGFVTSIEQERFNYPNDSAHEEYKKLVDKLNSGILPETLGTSKLIPFIRARDGRRLIDMVESVPEINTIEDLNAFLLKNNIDVTINGIEKK